MSRRSSKYESLDDGNEKPPAFKRLPTRSAQPLPGTIIVSCSVCGVVYQKRLDCEFFQCENCHAMVTHSTNGYAQPPPSISVVVNNQARESIPKTKNKKKKKKNRNASSSDSDSSSSSSSESDRKKKRSSKKVKELGKQVKELQRKSAGYVGTTEDEWPKPWPQVWPDSTPVSPSPAAQWGVPQLMDSPYRCNSEPWSAWSGGSSPSGGYANQPMNKALTVNAGDSPGNSNWGAWPSSPGNCNFPNSPSKWGAVPSNPWVSPQPPAQNSWRPPMNPMNPFGNSFCPPQITVNVPSDVASLSSDQLMMLANAKRYAEEQDQKQSFNLQIMPNKRTP